MTTDTVVHNLQTIASALADVSTKQVLSKVETGGSLAVATSNDASFTETNVTAGTTLSVQAAEATSISRQSGTENFMRDKANHIIATPTM